MRMGEGDPVWARVWPNTGRGAPAGLDGQNVELAVGVEADRDLKQAPARACERVQVRVTDGGY